MDTAVKYRRYSYSRKRKNRLLIFIGVVALFLACVGVGAYFYYDYSHRVYDTCVVELGEEVKARDFLKDESKEAVFTPESVFSTDVAGEYKVGIVSKPYTYKCTLQVQDTVAPELSVMPLTRTKEEIPQAKDFVESCSDLSNDVNIYFAESISFDNYGDIPVKIAAEDPSGNRTTADTVLHLVEEYDITPPIIEGQLDKIVYVGQGASFKTGVVVTDNVDTNIELQVDSSHVNLDVPGDYPIIYTAEDSMGNMDLAEGTITVIEVVYSEEQVNELADAVLADIIKPDMSDYDKAHAIYVWIQGNIGYSESEDRGDWLKGAYDGLKNRHGDCYNYFAVGKALLTRAGIKNEDIEIIPTATRHHFWSVIDCGEGWRHFDSTPRTDKTFKGFYITDEDLMAYSNEHYRSHNYDREVYTYFND
ncbi:transglutaminase-like domain-containing protein [Pseudobutyrivibrio xylanivorans]|uniref:Transglutaminase-like superfamily protein n=1 Tax=Pseudobutyrivibrio xylanivorans DSM 14809 TaxID=1123012 RepID=A0A1M6HVU9_PSEXY|nr:transglutaminase-like domain-containing protein [Pseudobutyrivibrio xylanivorans]SHJ26335.1 Transglutaminase-like superfamily protein [Pseudobutyrivibrio xylanivorans DSM 14809]